MVKHKLCGPRSSISVIWKALLYKVRAPSILYNSCMMHCSDTSPAMRLHVTEHVCTLLDMLEMHLSQGAVGMSDAMGMSFKSSRKLQSVY